MKPTKMICWLVWDICGIWFVCAAIVHDPNIAAVILLISPCFIVAQIIAVCEMTTSPHEVMVKISSFKQKLVMVSVATIFIYFLFMIRLWKICFADGLLVK